MAGKIFINYRRDDSIGMAGRLHDRLAHTFGRAKLFMDVDHIPVGTDFVAETMLRYLRSFATARCSCQRSQGKSLIKPCEAR